MAPKLPESIAHLYQEPEWIQVNPPRWRWDLKGLTDPEGYYTIRYFPHSPNLPWTLLSCDFATGEEMARALILHRLTGEIE
jgi:hypothetical protein